MAMANRTVLSGSAVRGRAAIIPAALGEAEQRSRAAAARKEATQRMKRYSRRGAAAAMANGTAGSGAPELRRAALCPAGKKENGGEKFLCPLDSQNSRQAL